MPRVNKSQISRDLGALRVLEDARLNVLADQEAKVAPLRARFNAASAPFLLEAQGLLAPLAVEMREIEARIEKEMLAGVGADGVIAVREVVAAGAIASVEQASTRTLDPAKLFAEVPEPERDLKFWGCVNVLIGAVDKAFGARFAAITLKKFAKARVSIRYVPIGTVGEGVL